MDRWAARAQRKSDERTARWRERQEERARSGRITAADRWMARAQRKGDERAARWQELEPLRRLVAVPVRGPGDSAAVISVDLTGLRWMDRTHPAPSTGGGGALVAAAMLISLAIWWLVFRRTYTVHVRTNDHPSVKIHVRFPTEVAAYRAAGQLVSRFQNEGSAALQGWRAGVAASASTAAGLPPAGS